MKEKNAAEERMAIVQAKLDEMQAQFDAAMAQKQVGAFNLHTSCFVWPRCCSRQVHVEARAVARLKEVKGIVCVAIFV